MKFIAVIQMRDDSDLKYIEMEKKVILRHERTQWNKTNKNSYRTKDEDKGVRTISELLHNYHISTPVVKSSQSSHIYTGREGKFHFYELIYLATSPKAPANTSVSQAWTLEL